VLKSLEIAGADAKQAHASLRDAAQDAQGLPSPATFWDRFSN